MSDAPGFEIELALEGEAAVHRVTDALKEEGFGVLTRIDLDQAFSEKLGIDFRPYAILGACNPTLAHRALTARPEVGLLLPCNVTVESTAEGGSLVRIIDPDAMLGVGALASDPDIQAVAREARARLERVAETLSA
ncbi:MAG: DUF302 domain-containing protein [Gemmatimonadota bacterium]|nr:DUF302 domain-containing protein [Gemmatimonadota bacterium]